VTVPARSAVPRPSRRDVGLMAIAVTAVATSAPLIVAAHLPALAVGFWRVALATAVIAPWVLARRRGEVAALTRRRCTTLAAIPLAGRLESLNVAAAAAVACFELARRRAGAPPDR